MNSRQKGKRGELELVHMLNYHGYHARRGQQYCGANGDADVIGLPYLHIECKRVEHLNIYDALDQARRDARGEEIPSVFFRKNQKPWAVCLEADFFLLMYECFVKEMKAKHEVSYERLVKLNHKDERE